MTLILVMGILPVLFAYFTFTSELQLPFLLAISGLAVTISGVIIPTEIRDYFGDKEMGIETMTVRLGLVHASLLSVILLSFGGILIGASFFITFFQSRYPILSLLVIVIAAVDLIVLQQFKKLYTLSKAYENANDQKSIAQKITDFSTKNPKWIMLATQTYSSISVVLLVSKLAS